MFSWLNFLLKAASSSAVMEASLVLKSWDIYLFSIFTKRLCPAPPHPPSFSVCFCVENFCAPTMMDARICIQLFFPDWVCLPGRQRRRCSDSAKSPHSKKVLGSSLMPFMWCSGLPVPEFTPGAPVSSLRLKTWTLGNWRPSIVPVLWVLHVSEWCVSCHGPATRPGCVPASRVHRLLKGFSFFCYRQHCRQHQNWKEVDWCRACVHTHIQMCTQSQSRKNKHLWWLCGGDYNL